jgi:hypothetical protein
LPGKIFGPAAYDGRSKSLWFFSYEGFREPFSVTRNRTVLTEEARKGIFRYTGANGQVQSVNLLQIGNVSALNAVTGAQLNAMPLPNNTLVGDSFNTAGYRYNVPGTSPNDKQLPARWFHCRQQRAGRGHDQSGADSDGGQHHADRSVDRGRHTAHDADLQDSDH